MSEIEFKMNQPVEMFREHDGVVVDFRNEAVACVARRVLHAELENAATVLVRSYLHTVIGYHVQYMLHSHVQLIILCINSTPILLLPLFTSFNECVMSTISVCEWKLNLVVHFDLSYE